MKKILISIVAAMMMLLRVATVSADSLPEVVYNGGPVTMIGNVTHVLMMKTGLEGATDASYSSADPSIVQILEGGVWNSDGVPLCPIIGIKQGSTTITANVKGGFGNRTIQIPITVVPYENPFTSFVICGVDVAPKLAKATTAFYTGIRGKQTITYALKAGWTADVYYGFWQNHNYTKISIKSGAITDLTDVRERGNNYIFAILKQESTGLRIEDLIILSDVGGTVTPIPDLPAPAPQPDPTPAPQTNPTPAPQTNPTPVPQTNPTPVPQTNPTPAPQTNPTPAPQTNPTPAPSVSPTPKPTETPAAEVTATITPSALRVRYKKKASIKITSDSDAKITVTGKNAFAKNKKYVKIKSGKTAKLVFSKRAVKGKYVFKVTCSAKGKYKKTVKNITIRVK